MPCSCARSGGFTGGEADGGVIDMDSGQRWVDKGWFLEAGTGRDLFQAIGAIGGARSKTRFAWRGMSSIDYDLVSSLQRTTGFTAEADLREEELRILSEAREWGLGYGVGGWATDHQLLADLQHYGTATRLIDVTSNPMTALWFACQTPVRAMGEEMSDDGVLLAINIDSWTRFGRSHSASTPASVNDPSAGSLERLSKSPNRSWWSPFNRTTACGPRRVSSSRGNYRRRSINGARSRASPSPTTPATTSIWRPG